MEKYYPKYLTSRDDSLRLVSKIAKFWSDQGRFDVRVWVEHEKDVDRTGETLYYIRSNLKFRCTP